MKFRSVFVKRIFFIDKFVIFINECYKNDKKMFDFMS